MRDIEDEEVHVLRVESRLRNHTEGVAGGNVLGGVDSEDDLVARGIRKALLDTIHILGNAAVVIGVGITGKC